jgi:hypothetical protein
MGFILYLIATVLFLPLTILNIICVLWKYAKTKGFFATVNGYFLHGALDIDVFSNHNFKTLWNAILRKPGGYSFGVLGETISSALGKNQRDKTLSLVGWLVVYVLWACDYQYWKTGGHCINSINNDLK